VSDPYDTRPTGYDPLGYEAGSPEASAPDSDPGSSPDSPSASPSDALRTLASESAATTSYAATPRNVQSTTIRCTTCGYNLTGVAIGSTCPECGSMVDPSLTAAQQPTSGKAIASMVLGICSIPAACMSYGVLGLPCAIIGLILWHLAKKELGSSTGSAAGMNTAGLVTSIVGLSFSVLGAGLILFFILMGIFA
jgi:predicted RNA-binding Zn-ribbon protein involved in translation (DUF1610 family)